MQIENAEATATNQNVAQAQVTSTQMEAETVVEEKVEEGQEAYQEQDGVINTNDDGELEAFSLDDLDMGDLDELEDVLDNDETGVIEASEDLSLATGNYIWYIGDVIPSTFKMITKNVNGKPVPVKLYSAGVMIRVVYDITNQTEVNEGFIQNFYFYSKDGKPNRMGLAQAKHFAISVLASYEGITKEEVQQQLLDERIGNLRLFKDLLPCDEDDIHYLSSKIRRKEGKGDYKGVFNNDIPNGNIKDAQALYESVKD